MSTTTKPAVTAYLALLATGDHADVVSAYVGADSGDKARMRAALTTAIGTAVRAGDGPLASALIAVQDDQTASVGTKTPATVDVDLVLAERYAVLTLAADRIRYGFTGGLTDEQLESVDVDRVSDLITLWTDADRTDADLLDAARKVADQPLGRRTAQPGGDIAAHVYQVCADNPGVELLVSTIQNASTDAYPNGAPSSGAITARLFPTDKDGNAKDCTIPGVRPLRIGAEGKAGATLA
jgi:hypothetical protein